MSIFGWSLPAGCGTLPCEEGGAYEQKIDGVWWTWDESDNVYRQDPKHPDARDDGYVYMGKIVWPQTMGPEQEPSTLLVEFARNHKGE